MPKVATETNASDAISKALKVVLQAQTAALDDLRTSGTGCTDYLASAIRDLESAIRWVRELAADERADEADECVVVRKRKSKPEPNRHCHICDEVIAPDDLAVCTGCDKDTCPEHMDEELCEECAAEAVKEKRRV